MSFRSVFSTNSSEAASVDKEDTFAVDNHANIKLQKRRKKLETRYQKALMQLHELIKSLDCIAEQFSIEGFSRKVLRAPVTTSSSTYLYIIYTFLSIFLQKNSKLFQFFSPASDSATTPTTEQINIEIVDDELNVVNEANINLPPEGTADVKTEGKIVYN